MVWLFFLSRESTIILIVVLLACIPQTVHAIGVENKIIEYVTYNLYTPLEYCLLFIIFYNHVENKKNRLLLKITAVFYTVASVFFVFYFNISRSFIAEWVVLNNVFYTAWILIIFFEQYAYNSNKSLGFRDSFFWYILALLLYAPCTGMIFSMWSYMKNENNSLLKIVHEIFNINMYVLFTIGFYKEYRQKKSVPV
jgi:hypothetical protein